MWCIYTQPVEITIKNKTKIERRKINRGKETIQVIIHTYMEMSQGNSLYRYLKQTKIFFSKAENRKAKQVLSGDLVPAGGGRI
jgi:hypothetical protein